MSAIEFTTKSTRAGRYHYLTEEDVLVLLGRLPNELWARLHRVHFNDQAMGNRFLGYVQRGHREISICALPANISLGRACALCRRSASEFGAPARGAWPHIAVRRFMLYDVFLHELGHLQMVNPSARSMRLKYARERRAEEFAEFWRRKLWSEHFEHPDPVHNRPGVNEPELSLRASTESLVAVGNQLSAVSFWLTADG